MADPVLVKDLLSLPEHIRKGDFVIKLAEGIDDPKTTAATYKVTPALAHAFDKALRLVGSALRDQKSQAAYLDGSFGSGKSHFMALLSLLLAGNEDAWRLPELHPLREHHGFVGTKPLLELHFHMIDRASLESAIFTEYLAFVRAHHPDAPIPAVFGDDKLFAMAADLMRELGEAKFFAPLNEGGGTDARWGKKAVAWDRARFEAASASTDPAVRAELFSLLVKKRFTGWETTSQAFVDLDSGLATISRHAASLGYAAIILFLDELILWLAGRASDSAWLHREAQKLVKLVEAEDMRRQIPIISFIARQRDLATIVGEQYAGAENARLRESLQWMKDRFEQILLEDKNLPAIVEHRVLIAKDDASRATLRSAFEQLRKGAGASWQTMLGSDDAVAFQKLYPFSPALVDVLVALSNSLQRQRTAIKLLMELLVEHIDDLVVGEVVRVGDLFDLLAAGEESADGVMRARFESAKHIYRHQLLPLIREQHSTGSAARCQRMRPDHPARLGCAACPEKACRTDNRLAKTLLVAALVPETAAVKDLTASRLVQLNHGSLKVPIAGTEASIVAGKLRGWASGIGQLQVGAQSDPAVSIRLEGVDVGPILERAGHVDNGGARTRVIRDLTFEALGLDKVVERGKDHKVDWRGTWRTGYIHFGNVRTMGPDLLRCAENHDWRLVVDYPFDDGNFGPNDDIEVLERFAEEGVGSWTLVWLPSFFSDGVEKLLGELVRLDEVLQTRDKTREYLHHLSVDDQSRALVDLNNLRSMKKARLLEVLAEAYGLARPKEGDLDTGRSLEQHLHLLKPGAKLLPQVPPNLAEAVSTYVEAILSARYPRHPRFSERLTKKRVEHLVERFGELVDAADKRIGADKALVDEMRGTLGELGLVRVTENAVHLVEDKTLQDLEQRRLQHAVDSPTVGQVRRWLDENDKMGLEDEADDLVVRCYARHAARTFIYFGKPYQPVAGTAMPEDVVLEKPELPGASAWGAALDLAGHTLGIALPGKALHADNLKRFEADLRGKLERIAGAAAQLPGRLSEWAELLAVDEKADRITTARSADTLVAELAGKGAVAQVETLAGFAAKTSPRAVGKSLASSSELVKLLADGLVIGVYRQLVARKAELAGAAELLEQAAVAVRQDEIHVALADRLRGLAEAGQRLLSGPVPVGPAPGPQQSGPLPPRATRVDVSATGKAAALARLDAAIAEARAAITALGDDVVVTGHIVVGPKPR
ncbi:MAG: hypothetical protein K8W52_21600 [Deltaproteobacteria bacterium]|nr:hypothetical protein [Deltaproteobacteria bacterium]